LITYSMYMMETHFIGTLTYPHKYRGIGCGNKSSSTIVIVLLVLLFQRLWRAFRD